LDLTPTLRSKVCVFKLNANITLTTAVRADKLANVIREIIHRNKINIFVALIQLETIFVAFLK
jgi:putative ubiquitin-RnfH superfamily antitoxin RatB of RatAB toxin-antitoxin module